MGDVSLPASPISLCYFGRLYRRRPLIVDRRTAYKFDQDVLNVIVIPEKETWWNTNDAIVCAITMKLLHKNKPSLPDNNQNLIFVVTVSLSSSRPAVSEKLTCCLPANFYTHTHTYHTFSFSEWNVHSITIWTTKNPYNVRLDTISHTKYT